MRKIDRVIEGADDFDEDVLTLENHTPQEVDRSEHWECHNSQCILRSPCYFNVHHPYYGPNSAPSDSWFISWIK